MDLSNSANWLLVSAQTKQVSYLPSPNPDSRSYYPLEPSEFQVSSPVLQVLVNTSDYVIPSSGLIVSSRNWYRAGWVSFYSQINNQPTRLGKRALTLRETNFLNFPYYGEELVPFLVKIDFPYWFRDVSFSLWEFQDKSGRYLSSPVEQSLIELEDRVNGETVTLNSVVYQELVDGDRVLQQSLFVGNTKYEQYEVGRFYRKDTGEKLSDPLLVVRPGRFEAIFTGIEKLPSGVITVSVKPL